MASKANGDSHLPEQVNQDEVYQALERVLSSKYFVHAPMKQKFLRLICEYHLKGRGSELNEFLIGQEVFGRDTNYNPSTDPIVRVGAHGVREKLELYYQKEGLEDEIRMEMPVGSYNLSFVRNLRQKTEEDRSAQLPTPLPMAIQPVRNLRPLFFYPILAVLLLAVGVLAYSNIRLRAQVQAATAQKDLDSYKLVWEPFIKTGSPTLMVLSNPSVFRFINQADPDPIIKKSIPLASEDALASLEALPNKSMLKIIPMPRLTLTSDTYTGIGEAIGVHRVTNVFRSFEKNISLRQSRTVSVEDLKNQNVIVLGSVWVNNWSGKLPAREEFIYSDDVTVKNLNPLPGEQPEYRASFDKQNGKLTEDYAIITVGPNISEKDIVMILAGLHSEGTAAAAEYVTTKHYLDELNQKLGTVSGEAGAPRYYQALLKAGVDNGIPTTITLVSLRELHNTL